MLQFSKMKLQMYVTVCDTKNSNNENFEGIGKKKKLLTREKPHKRIS